MKIAIVDDDIIFAEILEKYVRSFMERLFSKFEVDIVNNDFVTSIKKRIMIYFFWI